MVKHTCNLHHWNADGRGLYEANLSCVTKPCFNKREVRYRIQYHLLESGVEKQENNVPFCNNDKNINSWCNKFLILHCPSESLSLSLQHFRNVMQT